MIFLRPFFWIALLLLSACATQQPAPIETGTPRTPPGIYIVKSGDTLNTIARAHNMEPKELIAMNQIENPNRIIAGKALRVRIAGVADSTAAQTKPVSAADVEVLPIGRPEPEAAPTTTASKTLVLAGKIPYSDEAWEKLQSPQKSPPEKPASTETSPKETAPKETQGISWAWPAKGKIAAKNKGLDIANKAGTPVLAAAGGKVVYSGSGLRGYGKLVIIKHDTSFLSAYAHNQTILVKEGQNVKQGQEIAKMGNSDADDTKLHFEIRKDGTPVDPQKYLPEAP